VAQPTDQTGIESLNAHVVAKGLEIRERYGPRIGWKELQALLRDGSCVRYPCEILFDARELQPGEMAHPVCKGERPEAGFTMYVHPLLMTELDRVPYVVLYQLVLVNYGEFAGADDAETFGAAALGLTKDEYYGVLCEMADQLGANPTGPPSDGEVAPS
jgi:hypothetical protein